MGFGTTWRKWIKVCLETGYSSILIKGSPTKEFRLEKGVRQGVPLSLLSYLLLWWRLFTFLFLKLVEKKLFNGVKNNVCISQFKFADDVVFVANWSLMETKILF